MRLLTQMILIIPLMEICLYHENKVAEWSSSNYHCYHYHHQYYFLHWLFARHGEECSKSFHSNLKIILRMRGYYTSHFTHEKSWVLELWKKSFLEHSSQVRARTQIQEVSPRCWVSQLRNLERARCSRSGVTQSGSWDWMSSLVTWRY